MQPIPRREVPLPRELRGGVGRERLRLIVLARGTLALAVERAPARGEDEAGIGRARCLEHAHGAHDVDVRVEQRALDRGSDIRLRREVEDDPRSQPSDELLERLVADIDLVELGGGGEILGRAGRQVVHDVDFFAAREQGIDEVRTDEASSAGHHHPHRRRSVRERSSSALSLPLWVLRTPPSRRSYIDATIPPEARDDERWQAHRGECRA